MTKSSKAIYKKADTFSKLAKTHGYRSRSAIKLLEIQKKDNFIKPHAKVLDLGSSPGGWSQVSNEIVGKNGLIFGVDKKIMQPLKSVHFVNKGLENLCVSDFEVVSPGAMNFQVDISHRDEVLVELSRPRPEKLFQAQPRPSIDRVDLGQASRTNRDLWRKLGSSRAGRVFRRHRRIPSSSP